MNISIPEDIGYDEERHCLTVCFVAPEPPENTSVDFGIRAYKKRIDKQKTTKPVRIDAWLDRPDTGLIGC